MRAGTEPRGVAEQSAAVVGSVGKRVTTEMMHDERFKKPVVPLVYSQWLELRRLPQILLVWVRRTIN